MRKTTCSAARSWTQIRTGHVPPTQLPHVATNLATGRPGVRAHESDACSPAAGGLVGDVLVLSQQDL